MSILMIILGYLFNVDLNSIHYSDLTILLTTVFKNFTFVLICLVFIINISLYSWNFISKSFYNIDTNSRSFISQYFSLFILFMLYISIIVINIAFSSNDYLTLNPYLVSIFLNFINTILHSLMIFTAIFFFYSYIKFVFTQKNIKKVKNHWIDDYLNQKDRNNKVCLYYKDNIVGVFVKSIKLDISHKYNSVIFNGEDYNLNAFKTYLENKNCLVSDLTSDDLDVIDMLGIE